MQSKRIMKFILILITVLLFSCSKEEQCKHYLLVTESSEDSARQKCNGIANSHPTFKTIHSQSIGCLTSTELKEARKGESTTTQTYCQGVTFQIKVTIK